MLKTFQESVRPDRRFPNEFSVNKNVLPVIQQLRSDFDALGFRMANRCLDLLLISKGVIAEVNKAALTEQLCCKGSVKAANYLIKNRKNAGALRKDLSCAALHEIRQAVVGLGIIRSGLITNEAEEEYGSAETLVCTSLVHDLGEDYGLTLDALFEYLLSDDQVDEDLAERVCSNLELITYKRDGKHIYINNDQNLYLNALMQDPYALIAKYIDRNDNLATMLGAFSREKQLEYLNLSFTLFSLRSTDKQAKSTFQQMAEVFSSLDGMMGALYRLGLFHWMYHPEQNKPEISSKRLEMDTAYPVDFQGAVVRGLSAYGQVERGFNPLFIAVDRIVSSLKISHNAPVLAGLNIECALAAEGKDMTGDDLLANTDYITMRTIACKFER